MITLEQMGQKNIRIFGRDKEGNRYSKLISDFYPYFYDNDKKRVVANSPKDVPKLKENYPETYEADITYLNRFLIDKYDTPLEYEKPRICYLDIEVNLSLDVVETPEPIISICCFDTFLNKYVIFVWREDIKPKAEKSEDISILRFNSEIDMLMKFIEFIEETDPDIIAGWNVSLYDMSYLINRCKKIGVQIERISPMRYVTAPKNQPKKGQYSVDAEIKGRVIFDLLRAYKKLHQGEMQSFSLDWVAEKELGKSKVKIEQSKVWKDIPKLIEYNKFDVELSVMIDEKMRLIQHFNNLRLIAGCTWSSVWYNSFICDVLILREAKSRNILLPTKKKGVIKKEFTGAFVQKTTPGIHKNIILMDLQSLYPNIMRQFNVSFDTLDENGKYKINLIKSGGFFKANYISEPIGMIPSILTKLYDSRQKYKDKMKKYERGSMEWTAYDRLQFATKVLFNSLYGMLGYERFRLYNPIVAETVTLMGQHIIKWTKQKVEEFGFKVIYMDTDSIFVDARKNTLEEILEIEEKLNKFINDSYEELVKQFGCEKNTYLYMDFKCIYNKIFFTEAKKRYIGNIIYSDGKKLDKPEFEIKGFEMKKSNFSKFGKILSQKIFEMVLEGKTKIEVDEFIKNERKKIENNNEINMVSIPSSMKKNIWEYKTKSAVVRGAEFANDNLKEDFKAGSKMKFLYIKGTEKMPQTNVLCYSVDPPKGILVDWDKMFNNTIKNKINKIYEALGWGEFSDAESLMKWM